MSESERDEAGLSEATLPEPYARCQLCGAVHECADPILCRSCGEPVLLWGWAP